MISINDKNSNNKVNLFSSCCSVYVQSLSLVFTFSELMMTNILVHPNLVFLYFIQIKRKSNVFTLSLKIFLFDQGIISEQWHWTIAISQRKGAILSFQLGVDNRNISRHLVSLLHDRLENLVEGKIARKVLSAFWVCFLQLTFFVTRTLKIRV